MDYEDVVYVDGRNAAVVRPTAIDHRTGPTSGARIVRPAVVASMPSAPYQYPAMGYMPPGPSWNGYPVYPPYVMPPQVTPTSNLASILGGFGDIGTLANILAQAFAAFLPLPAAPTPQDANDSESASVAGAVNSSNLIRYQNALALFARRDQQILTLGSILKELFKRPGITVG